LYGKNGLIDVSVNPADLRLATGQAIEDGSGTTRLGFTTSQTFINDADSDTLFTANKFQGFRIRPNNDKPMLIEDQEGNFDAVTYETSASAPGTLELTNAQLVMNKNTIKNVSTILKNYSSPLAIKIFGTGNAIDVLSGNDTVCRQSFTNNSNETASILNRNGELQGEDNSGNSTTLT